ncbi:MAG: radical SAM protein [Chloroflexota bacterium]
MVKLIPKKGSTLHDFPYSSPQRKCPHYWIINITPPGPAHCVHNCLYCYARDAIYSDFSPEMAIYSNLTQLVESDLKRIRLTPPISISTISDPCQNVPEVRSIVKELVNLIMRWGIPFSITTKGDARFLLELPGFTEFKLKFVAVTIEGTDDILSAISPGAPPLNERLKVVKGLSLSGVDTLVRLDPLFIHLFYAVYEEEWLEKLEDLIHSFSLAGAKHIVASTGRLSRRKLPDGQSSSWDKIIKVVRASSGQAAEQMIKEYVFENSWAGRGLFLRRDLRVGIHNKIRNIAESCGMTYSVCQELGSKADSANLAHCERFVLPFSIKQPNGTFRPITDCTANCHICCRDKSSPPCGQPSLVSPGPFKMNQLKKVS